MLMVQVVMNCYIKDPDGFDKDLREIGADWVLLSHCELLDPHGLLWDLDSIRSVVM